MKWADSPPIFLPLPLAAPEAAGPGPEPAGKRSPMITIKSYGKINLTLDVLARLPSGYHQVEMILQQIELHDDVSVRFLPGKEAGRIQVHTNRPYLPTDARNLAWQAARLAWDRWGDDRKGTLRIDIKKRIPVAAGLAGGSSNGAAVLHAVSRLWKLDLGLEALCAAGGELGADVPFCLMGQAAWDPAIAPAFKGDSLAAGCALATGTGTELRPIPGLSAWVVLSKPPVSVSTREAYQGLDLAAIQSRPDNAEMIRALAAGDWRTIQKNMINVLEIYTMKRYDNVVYTKNKMQNSCPEAPVLMSGSGPTVYGIFHTREAAQPVFRAMKRVNRETFLTRTTP